MEDYILKPVNEKDLNDALHKIGKKLSDKEIFTKHQTELKRTIDKSNKIIRQNLLRNIIDQRENINLSDIPINMEGELYQGIDIKLDYIDCENMDIRPVSYTHLDVYKRQKQEDVFRYMAEQTILQQEA